MPTYQYACTGCGHGFEAVQSFTDASLTECPECQGRLRKVFSAVGIVFKGSGFYRTDSRGTSGGAAKGDAVPAASDASSAGSSGGGAEGSSSPSPAGAGSSAPAVSSGSASAPGSGSKGSSASAPGSGSKGSSATPASGSAA